MVMKAAIATLSQVGLYMTSLYMYNVMYMSVGTCTYIQCNVHVLLYLLDKPYTKHPIRATFVCGVYMYTKVGPR